MYQRLILIATLVYPGCWLAPDVEKCGDYAVSPGECHLAPDASTPGTPGETPDSPEVPAAECDEPEDGLLLHWDSCDGDLTVKDCGPYGQHLSLKGGALCRSNGVIDFSGGPEGAPGIMSFGEFENLEHRPEVGQQMAFSICMRRAEYTDAQFQFLYGLSGVTTEITGTTSGHLYVRLDLPLPGYEVPRGVTMGARTGEFHESEWISMIFIYDDGTWHIYRDGEEVRDHWYFEVPGQTGELNQLPYDPGDLGNIGGAPTVSTGHVGMRPRTGGESPRKYFRGQFHGVRFYGCTLSQEIIDSLADECARLSWAPEPSPESTHTNDHVHAYPPGGGPPPTFN